MAKKETSKSTFEVAAKFKRLAEIAVDAHARATLTTTYENLKKKADALLVGELKIKGMKFEAKHEGSDWWDQVKLMYPTTITEDGKFRITSEARDWLGEKVWEFDDKYLAIEYIERLVQWKNADRKAGHGDRDADIERALSLQAKREAQPA